MSGSSMSEATKTELAKSSAADLPRAAGPYACLACGAGIRTPRVLRNGKIGFRCRTRMGEHVDEPHAETFTTMTFCSQPCYDAWLARFHLPGPHWPVYNQAGELVAFVVPGRGRVSVEEIEGARSDSFDSTRNTHGRGQR